LSLAGRGFRGIERGRGGMGLYPTSVQQRVTNEDSIQHVMMLTCELYWQISSKGLQAEAGLPLCNSDLKSARSMVT
jgi:hypothetical protein